MAKFKWGPTPMNSPNKVHVMYRGTTTVGYIYGTSEPNKLVYDVFIQDFDARYWRYIGEFPTREEAEAIVEALVPLYWRDY